MHGSVEDALPALRRAAARYGSGTDADDLVQQAALRALERQAEGKDPGLGFARRRICDARRAIYGRTPRVRTIALDEAHGASEPVEVVVAPDGELTRWLLERVTSREPLDREIATRRLLGTTPLSFDERVALVLRIHGSGAVDHTGHGLRGAMT